MFRSRILRNAQFQAAAAVQTSNLSNVSAAAAAAEQSFYTNVRSVGPLDLAQGLKPNIVPMWYSRNSTEHVIDARDYINSKYATVQDLMKDTTGNNPLASDMRSIFARFGVVHLKHTGLGDHPELMRQGVDFVMQGHTAYEGGANPRGEMLENVYDVGAPLTAYLHYHHEMAYKKHSCRSLGFMCLKNTMRKGHGYSYVSDAVSNTDEILNTDLGRKLRETGIEYQRILTDRTVQPDGMGGVYNSWQQSWMTDDMAEAQNKAETQGLRVEWQRPYGYDEGWNMRTFYTQSAYEYCPGLDRNLFFASLADDGAWFDKWPGLAEVPYVYRPLRMVYGDGTEFSEDDRMYWVDLFDRNGQMIDWETGDIAVVDNRRFAHGRPGIDLEPGESRELGVMLGTYFERQQELDGKW